MSKGDCMPKRLVVIPARGGSKRIPKKNIKEFFGKPIISYSLSALEKSKLFDEIHVSTDDNEILGICSEYGSYCSFLRPKNLSDDHTGILPVLRYVVSEFQRQGKVFDQIWLASACAPLLREEDYKDIANFYDTQVSKKNVTLISEYNVSAYWALSMDSNNNLSTTFNNVLHERSQDLNATYFDTGLVAVFDPEMLMKTGEHIPISDFIGYVAPKNKAFDIDDLDDWEVVKALYYYLTKN
ncbi:acylneuraminate cytidylyltransferase family protein [Amylibacter sp.]|nr:acylneuraminate cytidylyltransferase family protein [Amylibacter sp.]